MEGLPDDVAVEDHAFPLVRSIRVRGPVRWSDPARPELRVLDGVDVDRLPVGMHRPGATDAVAVPAVERRRVVVLHRALVVGAVPVDQPHPVDREASRVELPEQPGDIPRRRAMHHEPAVMRQPVEPPEGDADQTQVAQSDRASGTPRRPAHQIPDRRRERPHARPVRRRRRRRRHGGRRERNEDERQHDQDESTSHPPMMAHRAEERPTVAQDEGGSRSPRPFLRAADCARRNRRLLSPS